jgi:hypothetical protein
MRAALALVALCLLAGPLYAKDQGAWPFGAGTDMRSRGRDLYNLGLLGAKASDADAQPAPTQMQGGGRRSGAVQAGGDEGPARFRIEILYPEGPAAKAGLAVGDVILGVGRSAFKESSLAELAKALLKAESGKGVVTLFVGRQGAEKGEKVAVPIPTGGKAMAKPTKGPGRTQIVDAGLAWLARRQGGDGGYAQTLSGINGAVVQAALAGLAWLAGGSDLKSGPYKDNVAAAAKFVAANAGNKMSMGGAPGRGGANWDQTNWGYAHAAIFLGELQARTPDEEVRRALMECGKALAERQEATGGWAHGPGGPNALGYVELNIVTGLSLAGLGLAQQAGYRVPQEVLDLAEAYLKASSGGDGGVGYSSQGGQRGQGNIGRTAIAWLGYLTLGLGKGGWGAKMKKWVGRNAGDIFGGHASLMQHILLAGVAAHAQGGKAKSAYWAAALPSMTLARAPDGSFQPRPWHETLSMGSNSDVTFGEVWTTAAWTIVLASEPEKGVRPGLPYWMGLKRVAVSEK